MFVSAQMPTSVGRQRQRQGAAPHQPSLCLPGLPQKSLPQRGLQKRPLLQSSKGPLFPLVYASRLQVPESSPLLILPITFQLNLFQTFLTHAFPPSFPSQQLPHRLLLQPINRHTLPTTQLPSTLPLVIPTCILPFTVIPD